MLAQVDKAADVARRAQLGELGELKIGFTSSAPFNSSIPQAIFAFRQAFPAVHLNLQEMSSTQVAESLVDESIQVGLMRPLPLPDSLNVIELMREPLVAVLSAGHPLAQGSERGLHLEQLAEEPLCSSAQLRQRPVRTIAQPGPRRRVQPALCPEAGEAMTIIGLVAAGLGVSVLPASYQRIRIDGVVYRTLLDPQAVTAVWLVQRKGAQTPMAKGFVELLTRKAAQ